MKSFKNSVEYKRIFKELETVDILSEEAFYEFTVDSIATFTYTDNETVHEFSLATMDFYSRRIEIEMLLNLKDISFFQHRVILLGNSYSKYEVIAEMTWRRR